MIASREPTDCKCLVQSQSCQPRFIYVDKKRGVIPEADRSEAERRLSGIHGGNIVERGRVLALARFMDFRAFHATRPCSSMDPGSARLRRLDGKTGEVFVPPKNSFIPAPKPCRIMASSFSPGTQFATVFCGEGPAPPVCRQRSGIPGEVPSKGSPAGTTARACWTST